jgi:hypothetical protein
MVVAKSERCFSMTTSIQPQPKKLDLWKKFVRLQNPFMKWLLNSPLHFLVSKSYMLIHVTGRKTGKIYSTPVQYHQQGNTLMVVTSCEYQWWRNLIGGAEVALKLRGQSVTGYATIALNPDVILNALGKMYPSMSFEAREKVAMTAVAIYISLDKGE